jgi:hypothetical protein
MLVRVSYATIVLLIVVSISCSTRDNEGMHRVGVQSVMADGDRAATEAGLHGDVLRDVYTMQIRLGVSAVLRSSSSGGGLEYRGSISGVEPFRVPEDSVEMKFQFRRSYNLTTRDGYFEIEGVGNGADIDILFGQMVRSFLKELRLDARERSGRRANSSLYRNRTHAGIRGEAPATDGE